MNEDQQKELQRARDTVKDYGDELVNGWNQEIDGFLTFVRVFYQVFCRISRVSGVTFQNGLFSAILTAFTVQSY